MGLFDVLVSDRVFSRGRTGVARSHQAHLAGASGCYCRRGGRELFLIRRTNHLAGRTDPPLPPTTKPSFSHRSWSLAAIATLLLFLHNFNLAGPPRQSLWASIRFYRFAVGDVLGFQPGLHDNFSPGLSDAVLVFGLVIVVLGVGAVVVQLIRRPDEGGGPVGIALICFGLLFAGLIADGRAIFGFGGACWSPGTPPSSPVDCGWDLPGHCSDSRASRNRRRHVEAPAAETVAGNSRRSARQGPIAEARSQRSPDWPAGSLSR